MITCNEGTCPGALTCGADKFCHATGNTDVCSTTGADAVPTGVECFGAATELFQVCVSSGTVLDHLAITNNALDTDTDAQCTTVSQASGPDVCFIAVEHMLIDAPFTSVVGSRPLVVGARSTIELTAQSWLYVAQVPNACGNLDGIPDVDGGGGAAGGSFNRIAGGAGGASLNVLGGASNPPPTVTSVRPGCTGGSGAGAMGANASGGLAGGAIYLIAKGAIILDGGQDFSTAARLSAYGAPGVGGSLGGVGGGGGGSGGMIGLIAPTLQLGANTRVVATGGGGGGGSTTAVVGGNGGTPMIASASIPATGGTGAASDDSGGVGGTGVANALVTGGTTQTKDVGGGGGGGGAGVIVIHAVTNLGPGIEIVPTPQ